MYKKVNKLLGTNFKSDEDVNWVRISDTYKLSEEFILEFLDYINPFTVALYQKLSDKIYDEFIRRNDFNINKVFWDTVSSTQILTKDQLIKYQNYLNWYSISSHQIFIDIDNLENFEMFDKIDKCLLNDKNTLRKIFNKTKDKGWFFGSLEKLNKEDEMPNLYMFVINCSNNIRNFDRKYKIYWNELITNFLIEKKDIDKDYIRKVKYL